jgi:queuine tRNA-ribosyltransferase
MKFSIQKEMPGQLGRVGEIETAHGIIKTPAFVTVGTKGTVKALTLEQVKELGAQVVLGNTYHLYLEPGDERVKKAGGIHKFMNWNGPTMTDSGGFQVFSLGAAYGKGISKILKAPKELILNSPSQNDGRQNDEDLSKGKIARIDENGVMFRSHIDGSAHYFTPEKSIAIQHNIGADIIFAFDECTSPTESLAYQRQALDRTHRWARQSLEYHKNHENSKWQALFGIVQGGRNEKLRKESAEVIANMEFDGFGIGGSFEKEDMSTAVRWVNEILPKEKPRHLLGIGEPEDLFMAIENGCDLFDCVTPTRIARTGTVYSKEGKINLANTRYQDEWEAIDKDCGCYTCKNYTRGYLAHLFRSKEMLGATLASIHNLHFIIRLVDNARQAIVDDEYEDYKNNFLKKYK